MLDVRWRCRGGNDLLWCCNTDDDDWDDCGEIVLTLQSCKIEQWTFVTKRKSFFSSWTSKEEFADFCESFGCIPSSDDVDVFSDRFVVESWLPSVALRTLSLASLLQSFKRWANHIPDEAPLILFSFFTKFFLLYLRVFAKSFFFDSCYKKARWVFGTSRKFNHFFFLWLCRK